MESIMLMGPITVLSENNGGSQVSYLVCTASRSPNLMLSQSSQGISWNESGAEVQSPFSVGMEGTLLLPLSPLSLLHCIAKSRGDSQQRGSGLAAASWRFNWMSPLSTFFGPST